MLNLVPWKEIGCQSASVFGSGVHTSAQDNTPVRNHVIEHLPSPLFFEMVWETELASMLHLVHTRELEIQAHVCALSITRKSSSHVVLDSDRSVHRLQACHMSPP